MSYADDLAKLLKRPLAKCNEPASLVGTTSVALVIFYVYITVHALLVFILEFTVVQIIAVSLTFAALLVLLGVLFLRPTLFGEQGYSVKFNLKTLLMAVGVSVVLMLSANSVSPTWASYVHTFPLLETELGLGWHQDTVYHTALIQSILNFGYPSIAQHGHPLTAYHVLSHYTDALVLWVTGLQPYDSYGLLFHFKVYIFLSSILLMITAMTRRHGIITYLVATFLLIPPILGTWHAIGSHGLWMASVLLLLSTPYVYDRLYRSGNLTSLQLTALFFIVVTISLAKISTGFMLATLIGGFILAKQPVRVKTYLFGGALLLFFYLYGDLYFSKLNHIEGKMEGARLSLQGAYQFLTEPAFLRNGQQTQPEEMPGILSGLMVLLVALFCKPDRNALRALLAAAIAVVCLYVITKSNPGLGFSDIGYFHKGLSSAMLLFTFAAILQLKQKITGGPESSCRDDLARSRLFAVTAIVCLAFLTQKFPLPSISVFNTGFQSIVQKVDYAKNNAFARINQRLPANARISVVSPQADKDRASAALTPPSVSRPLRDLRVALDNQLQADGIAKENAVLFIPKETFQQLHAKVGGISWADGLLAYVVTGVPFANAVEKLWTGYGFAQYKQDSLQVSAADFKDEMVCDLEGVSRVYKLTSLMPIAIGVADCDQIRTSSPS